MKIDEKGRECTVCNEYLEWSKFNKNRTSGTFHDNRCRDCTRLYRKSDGYRAANRLRANEKYLDENERQKQIERMRQQNKRMRSVYQNNPDLKEAHNEKLRITSKRWRVNNLERSREIGRIKMRKTMSNPRNRFSNRISRSMWRSLKGAKNRQHWEKLVPYTLDELIKHIESLWETGMSWDNYKHKGWHIDHILPISSFSFVTYEDQGFKDCWALSNLMPRWSTTEIAKQHGSNQIGNFNKGNKIVKKCYNELIGIHGEGI